MSEPKAMAVCAALAADTKLGTDIEVIDVGDVLAITDFFVIATAANARQVKAVAEAVEEAVHETFAVKPVRIEGLDGREWVLMDFGPFVMHVFNPESRAFYGLERLWSDQPTIAWHADRVAGPSSGPC